MEKLHVKNFLVIKNAEFDVGKINLIIGSQANGKSVLAKLLYFFREFLTGTYIESVRNFGIKKDLEKKALSKFEKYFPKYTWSSRQFEIIYTADEITIHIIRQKLKSGQIQLKFDYSASLVSLHKKLKISYKKKQSEAQEEHVGIGSVPDVFLDVIEECIFNNDIGLNFNAPMFIPASRSFFATLQKNVFSFLASDIDIDPFIHNFGSHYQRAKRFYEGEAFREKSLEKIKRKINLIVESILVGKYKYEDDQDWIEQEGEKVNLTNASSGQQEALPMLLVMAMSSLSISDNKKMTLFIEEPEAQLFPVSQKHIISLIGLIYNMAKHDFVITTHSPYILTAINNMVLAYDIAREKGGDKLNGIVDQDFAIKYEDVRAYTIKDGVLISILDKETRLIGANVIDSVSDEFDMVFDKLLNTQAGI